MTRTGRNNTVVSLLTLFFFLSAALFAAFLYSVVYTSPDGAIRVDAPQWRAVSGATIMNLLALVSGVVFIRLFRRSPSVPVFFVMLFFVFSMIDISKLGQVMIPATSWRNVSPLLARVTIFGHMASALSLFAAGLYAGVARMQRHGTAMTLGFLITVGLSWAIPIDTLFLPENLVYSAGFHPSLDAMIAIVFALAVLNFLQSAVAARDRRQTLTAGAVVLIAVGRELLYFRTEATMIVAGTACFAVGVVVFAVQNYRDFLVG